MSVIQTILNEMETVLQQVETQAVSGLANELLQGKRIFVVGEGRSGLIAKSFAMRLMHLGAYVYVVGETITPALRCGDVLVAVSGSGTTSSVVSVAKKARDLDCPVLAVTTDLTAALAATATQVLHVPAATKYRRDGEQPSVQPLGSLFDQCAHVLFDAVCLEYAKLTAEDNSTAFARHSNLE